MKRFSIVVYALVTLIPGLSLIGWTQRAFGHEAYLLGYCLTLVLMLLIIGFIIRPPIRYIIMAAIVAIWAVFRVWGVFEF